MNFLTFTFWFSSPIPTDGETASGCMGLSCQLVLNYGRENITKPSRGDGTMRYYLCRKWRGHEYQGPGWCHVPLPLLWEMGSRKLTLWLAIDAHEGLSIFSEAEGRFWGQKEQMETNGWGMRELFVLTAVDTGICAACYTVIDCYPLSSLNLISS